MMDIIMAMVMGAGLTVVVVLVLTALREEREAAREREMESSRPGRHSLGSPGLATRRMPLPDRRFQMDDTQGLVRPWLDDVS